MPLIDADKLGISFAKIFILEFGVLILVVIGLLFFE